MRKSAFSLKTLRNKSANPKQDLGKPSSAFPCDKKRHSRRNIPGTTVKISFYLLRDSPFAARSNARHDLVPIDPFPVIRTVWLFKAHVAFVVYTVFRMHQDACGDSSIQYSIGDGQLVAQDTTDYKLEGVFEDFFPAVRAAGFSLVAWMRKAELTDREVWVAFDRRAFEGKGLVEVENSTK